MTESESAQNSLDHWLRAVNSRGNKAMTDAALAPDAIVERFGFGTQEGELVQTLVGTEDINAWLAMSPKGTVFTHETAPARQADADPWQCDYRLEVRGFVGRGQWLWSTSTKGKITRLRHLPAPLNEAIVPETDKSFNWRVLAQSLGRDDDA